MSRDDPTAHQRPAYRSGSRISDAEARRDEAARRRQGRGEGVGDRESRRGTMTKATKTLKFAQVKRMLAPKAIKQ
jgi:hypothetical protein